MTSRKNIHKQYTYDALQSQFQSESEFETFYSNLKNNQVKDDFLQVGLAYLFFVKNGDWHINVAGFNPLIPYLTNSFKLVSTLSIIEGLSNKKYIDFFQWLNKKENCQLFPISNQAELKKHYELYKKEYGSIHKVKDFFNSLSAGTKANLCKSVMVGNKEIENIEELIKLIYQARSYFTHSTKPTLIFNSLHFGKTKQGVVTWRCLKLEYFLTAVEEGIVLHFKKLSNDVT